ncbi:MAG: outer membrane protein assembly factor BamB family protein [Candidatus Eutrophobiaceae bacterium]
MSLKSNKIALFCLSTLLCHISGFALAAGENADWSLYGHKLNNQRHSPLKQINQGNVSHLKPAWVYETGLKASFQASPIVVDGVMYITTPFNHVIALDASTGKDIWRYRHQLRGSDFCCGPANRGPAVAQDKVFMATIDARLIALDRHDGTLLWDVQIADASAGVGEALETLKDIQALHEAKQTGHTGYSANLAPQVYDGKIFVGITGAGYGLHLEQDVDGEKFLTVGGISGKGHGLRGFLVAYDIDSGKELWRWHSVPDSNWHGDWVEEIHGHSLNRDIAEEQRAAPEYADTWKLGGGSVWTTPAIDPELGLIYVGTGNPSPQMDATTRPGDNLHTVSLVALEVDTGKLRWHYQYVPHDRWGYDVASPPVLFKYRDGKQEIPAVGHASKLGWFFIHDRRTGKLLSRSEPFVQQENLFARPSPEGVRIVPGTLGATSWSPVAYNPLFQAVYIAGIYQPSLFVSSRIKQGATWVPYTFFRKTGEPEAGNFTAISVNDGRILWSQPMDKPMVGGALSTSGDLVFTGDGSGRFHAFAAESGKSLWKYQGSYGFNAPPITYMVNGIQYVAVANGGNQLFGFATGDRIIAFALDPKIHNDR